MRHCWPHPTLYRQVPSITGRGLWFTMVRDFDARAVELASHSAKQFDGRTHRVLAMF